MKYPLTIEVFYSVEDQDWCAVLLQSKGISAFGKNYIEAIREFSIAISLAEEHFNINTLESEVEPKRESKDGFLITLHKLEDDHTGQDFVWASFSSRNLGGDGDTIQEALNTLVLTIEIVLFSDFNPGMSFDRKEYNKLKNTYEFRSKLFKYTCPVCGYRELVDPPKDWEICHCCGTEFGNDDYQTSHEELRKRWITAGMPWFSNAVRKPRNWNPVKQLEWFQ